MDSLQDNILKGKKCTFIYNRQCKLEPCIYVSPRACSNNC